MTARSRIDLSLVRRVTQEHQPDRVARQGVEIAIVVVA